MGDMTDWFSTPVEVDDFAIGLTVMEVVIMELSGLFEGGGRACFKIGGDTGSIWESALIENACLFDEIGVGGDFGWSGGSWREFCSVEEMIDQLTIEIIVFTGAIVWTVDDVVGTDSFE